MKMSPVVHFEMPAKDQQRMAKFYTTAFGWKTETLGEGEKKYVMVQTTETDKNGLPKERGAINGGFFQHKDAEGYRFPSVVISVDDLQAAMKAVEAAGGKVVFGPEEIPGIGNFITIVDTEGNRVGVLQPSNSMK